MAHLQVPQGLDPDAIVASLDDGVLPLVIPMPEARRPRKITITGAHEQPVIEASHASSEHEAREPAGATA